MKILCRYDLQDTEVEFEFRLSDSIDTSENRSMLRNKILEFLGDDSDLFRCIAVSVGVLSVSDIRLFPKNGMKQLRVTTSSKSVETAINLLISKLDVAYPAYRDRIVAGRQPSPAVYVRKYIKDNLGITPTFRYSDSEVYGQPAVKLVYHLWSLPCCDRKTDTMDWEAFYDLKSKLVEVLENDLEDQVLRYHLDDEGSSRVYGAWTIWCKKYSN